MVEVLGPGATRCYVCKERVSVARAVPESYEFGRKFRHYTCISEVDGSGFLRGMWKKIGFKKSLLDKDFKWGEYFE